MFQNLTEKENLSKFVTRVSNDLKFQILHFQKCSSIKILHLASKTSTPDLRSYFLIFQFWNVVFIKLPMIAFLVNIS